MCSGSGTEGGGLAALPLIWLNQYQLHLCSPGQKQNKQKKPFSVTKGQASYLSVAQQSTKTSKMTVIWGASPDCTLKGIKGGSAPERTCLQVSPKGKKPLEDPLAKG